MQAEHKPHTLESANTDPAVRNLMCLTKGSGGGKDESRSQCEDTVKSVKENNITRLAGV